MVAKKHFGIEKIGTDHLSQLPWWSVVIVCTAVSCQLFFSKPAFSLFV